MKERLANEAYNEGEHTCEKKQPSKWNKEEWFDEKAVFINMGPNNIITNATDQTCYQK